MTSIRFLGANREVTGSSYILDHNGFKVMVDCGSYQEEDLEHRNYDDFLFDPKEINTFILTHSHLDHCGLIPKLIKHGFSGNIYLTPPSKDIFEITAFDSAKIQKEDNINAGKKIIYNSADVVESLSKCKTIEFGEVIELEKDFHFSLRNTGHILGAGYIVMDIEDKTVIFSGDVGSKWQSISQFITPISKKVDFLVIESTYGNSLHMAREESENEFVDTIKQTVSRGGNIIMPTFSIERAQELLYTLRKLKIANRIPNVPIYLDSPMASKVTKVFVKFPKEFGEDARKIFEAGQNPFFVDNLRYVNMSQKSKKIASKNTLKGQHDSKKSYIVLAGSGMCTGGRILGYLKKNLPLSKNTVIFPGFQANGTLGREIKDGAKSVVIYGEEVKVNAEIRTMGSFSAHGDRDDLLNWVSTAEGGKIGKRVYVTHGDEDISLQFAETLKEKGMADEVEVPYFNTVHELW